MNDVKYSSAQESFALPKGCKVFPIDPITSSLSTVLLAIPDGVEVCIISYLYVLVIDLGCS